MPKKEGNRLRLLNNLKEANQKLESTVIIYEAPHRLIKTLKSIESVYGEITVVIARELTKIHEQIFKSELREAILYYENKNPKGEFIILFNIKDF